MTMKISDGVEFLCPGCKAKCVASPKKAVLMHAMPMCKDYETREPVEFLQWVNAQRKS
jgi:hypothetical protein